MSDFDNDIQISQLTNALQDGTIPPDKRAGVIHERMKLITEQQAQINVYELAREANEHIKS